MIVPYLHTSSWCGNVYSQRSFSPRLHAIIIHIEFRSRSLSLQTAAHGVTGGFHRLEDFGPTIS
jgi:hypothetical protein